MASSSNAEDDDDDDDDNENRDDGGDNTNGVNSSPPSSTEEESEEEAETNLSSSVGFPLVGGFLRQRRLMQQQRQGQGVAGILSDMFAASEIFSSRADNDSEDSDSFMRTVGVMRPMSPDALLRRRRRPMSDEDDGDDSSLTTVYLNSDEEQQQQDQPPGLKECQIKRLPVILFTLPKISPTTLARPSQDPRANKSSSSSSSKKSGGKRSHKEAKRGGATAGVGGSTSKAASSSSKPSAADATADPAAAAAAAVDPDRVQCSICMCDYTEGDPLRLLLCFHRFHKDCIDPWLTQKPQCPICRTQIDIPEENAAGARDSDREPRILVA